jgi:hypothetical protein
MMVMSQVVTIADQIQGFIVSVEVFCDMVELFQLLKERIATHGNQ